MFNIDFVYDSANLPSQTGKEGIRATLNYLDTTTGQIKSIMGKIGYGRYTTGYTRDGGFSSKSYGLSMAQEGIMLRYFDNSNNGSWVWFIPDDLSDIEGVLVFAFKVHGRDIDSYVRSIDYGLVLKINTANYGDRHPLNLIYDAVRFDPYRPEFNLFGDYLAVLLLSLLVEYKEALAHPFTTGFLKGKTLGSALYDIASRKHSAFLDAMLSGDIKVDPAQLLRGSKYLGRDLYPQYYSA
jgi:hypothetical protein